MKGGLVTSPMKGVAGVAITIALWELVRATGLIDARDLPSFLSIARAAATDMRQLVASALGTLAVWAPGLGIAVICGGAAGLALALMPRLEVATRPVLEFVRPIPSVALIPVALIVLGLGPQMEIALIAFASVWPVLFNTKAGAESVDPRLIETGVVFGLERTQRVRRIVLPAAMPSIATGIRTAAAIALVLAITVEMIAGQKGLGYYMQFARLNGQAAQTWAATIFTGVLGLAMNTALQFVERRLLRWSSEHRDA